MVREAAEKTFEVSYLNCTTLERLRDKYCYDIFQNVCETGRYPVSVSASTVYVGGASDFYGVSVSASTVNVGASPAATAGAAVQRYYDDKVKALQSSATSDVKSGSAGGASQ